MKVTFWGTRGSLPAAGPETDRYGGNTSCVEVRGTDGTVLILDAGSGIRRLGTALTGTVQRIDLLLTHLHMDHIQGFGFFAPLYDPAVTVHIWGPTSAALSLRTRLTRYLSPPLFPVRLRDLPSTIELHEVPCGEATIGEFRVAAALVCHPGPTVGYRITSPTATLAYLPDHEPALGVPAFPLSGEWTSGYDLAAGVDLLIHDAQYTTAEYAARVGWGHSALPHTRAFAQLAAVKHLVPFHHEPSHDDRTLDRLMAEIFDPATLPFRVTPGREGLTLDLGASRP
ncbi:MAG TPA: MBL fold metallo-hydrolase [Chloroflexia bacterium]|nr:MBL fold metallo-hydrolase [Chloroflexia bacterium]